jgi:outer membrane usher protein
MLRRIGIFLFPIFLISPLRAQEEVLMPVPFYIDGVYSGEIPLRINGKVLVEPLPLLEGLRPLLEESQLDGTITRWNEGDWVPYETLAGTLINTDFDESQLIFSVTIPPEARRPGDMDLVQAKKAPPGSLAKPALLSGVLNGEGRGRFDYEDRIFSYQFQPELAVNYGGFVLEARGSLRSAGDPLSLDTLRLVRDFPDTLIRSEAGSLTYDADGFRPAEIIGISFYRNTSLDYSYLPRPELGRTIFFPEPVDVEILINGRSVRKTYVPAGTWTIKNFPLTQGPNDVEIRWTDGEGEHSESFFQIYDTGLLKPKETDWGFSVGTDSWTAVNPALLFHVSRGVSGTFTAGAGTYYDWNRGFFAVNAPFLLATSAGTFRFIPDLDFSTEGEFGIGLNLNHSFSERRVGRRRQSFGTSLGYRMESYALPSQRVSLRSYYVYQPLKSLTITPSCSWSYEMVREEQALNLSARVRTGGDDGSSISADLGVVYEKGEWAPRAAVVYSASFPDVKQNFYARGDLSAEKMTVSWNRYSSSEGTSDYTLGVSSIIPANNRDRFTLSANGGYLHPHFNLNLSQGFNAFLATEEMSNATSLSFGTALVYADGALGFSRPVRGSFVIFDSQIGPLSVNPTSRGSLLEVNGEDPTVLTSLSSYRYATFRMMPETLPIGADINDYTTSVFPSYRRGTLIRAQEKITMYAGGFLTDGEGRPLELAVGEISPDGGDLSGFIDGEWPREFFSDEGGYFECYGLIPGSYRLTIKGKDLTFKVDVTIHESGFCDLGEVKPEI